MENLNIILGIVIIALNSYTIGMNVSTDIFYGFKSKHYIIPILLLIVGICNVIQGIASSPATIEFN